MIGFQVKSLRSLNDTSNLRDLVPGAQAGGDGIGAGMGADTSCIRIRSVLLSKIYCCPDVVDDGALAIEGVENGHRGG